MNEEKGKSVETSNKREKLVGGGWQNCKVSCPSRAKIVISKIMFVFV
jgi:hypothetical protein